ncbi:hypothetical protein Gogos_003646, partial [Gossypium gossypioides]|nr:hypothetical protein [Gossypium gossypioides]
MISQRIDFNFVFKSVPGFYEKLKK